MSKKKDLRYTLDRLYECRNIEISNLWQRSVFLSVFLLICFSAYGYLGTIIINCFDGFKTGKQSFLNNIGLFLSTIGGVFSIVWILMSKSSKAWYEVYEKAIYEFESKYYKRIDLPKEFIMGEMKAKTVNKSIFSTSGGSFSPSRINIAIGQISLILWLSLLLSHILLMIIFNFGSCVDIISLIVCLFILIVASILLIQTKWLESEFLGK